MAGAHHIERILPQKEERYRKVALILWVVFGLNILVSVSKLVLGLATNCLSVFADGIHSLSDGASNVIGLLGIRLARQPKDFDHPYGHRRYETLASLAIAFLLLFVFIHLTEKAWDLFWNPRSPEVPVVSFVIMAITMVINIGVTIMERAKAKELKSDLLRSDALHTASDVLVTFSVILGLVFIRLGWQWVDPLITACVALVILWVAVGIVKDSSDILCDRIVLDAAEVRGLVTSVEGVRGCHMIRSRGRRDDAQIDLHILVADETDVKTAHELSHRVEEKIRGRYEGVSDVVVHIEPESSVAEGHI